MFLQEANSEKITYLIECKHHGRWNHFHAYQKEKDAQRRLKELRRNGCILNDNNIAISEFRLIKETWITQRIREQL